MTGKRVSLLVPDTGPLITLAAAESLDYLLYPNVPLVIPDAVFYEATRDSAKLGAQSIIDWVKENHAHIEIAATTTYAIFDLARTVDPTIKQKNLGEQAAIELIEENSRLSDHEMAILLCEETYLMRRLTVRDPDKIIEISTMDFLKMLEGEQRIQSADAVFERALSMGRSASQVEKLGEHDPSLRLAVLEILQQTGQKTGQ